MTDVHYYIDDTVTMIDLPYGNELQYAINHAHPVELLS